MLARHLTMQQQRCLAFPDLIEGYGTLGIVDGEDQFIRTLITHYKGGNKIPLVDDTAQNNSASRLQGSGAPDVEGDSSKETLPSEQQEQDLERIETLKDKAVNRGQLKVQNLETGKRQQVDSADDSVDSEEGYGKCRRKKAKVTPPKVSSKKAKVSSFRLVD